MSHSPMPPKEQLSPTASGTSVMGTPRGPRGLTQVTHRYTSPGTYSVTLTVTGVGGTDSLLRPGYVTVTTAPLPPTASFTGTPTSGIHL
ncbi:MAG: PKD domain-containing protein [Methanomicrobiales archaeon]|nr:PKD domain-containing protein [Methanomicrobiales archaeon]